MLNVIIIDPQICYINLTTVMCMFFFDTVATSHHLYKVYGQSSCVLKVKTVALVPVFC